MSNATTTPRVQEILGNYGHLNAGVRRNLHWMMMTGRLAGSGFLNPYPVDQGIEHGPDLSFAVNPAGYDPMYHAKFAIDAGCSAYAAPPGFIEAVAPALAGQIPFILKVNSKEALAKRAEPRPAQTATVQRALELGCAAIGFTIYPGSGENIGMYEQLRQLVEEAHHFGLVVVVWSYPRGSGLASEGETAVDIVCYAAQMACQLGADIVKVKPPTEVIFREKAKKLYEAQKIEVDTLEKRVWLVIQSAFAGQRIVIFSGGAKKDDEAVITEIQAIRKGGGFGSIMGRNLFQRERGEALKLIRSVHEVYLK